MKKISSVTQISTFPLGYKVLLGFENLCPIRATKKSIVNVDYYYNSLADMETRLNTTLLWNTAYTL
jgi:hypothetical protein